MPCTTDYTFIILYCSRQTVRKQHLTMHLICFPMHSLTSTMCIVCGCLMFVCVLVVSCLANPNKKEPYLISHVVPGDQKVQLGWVGPQQTAR